MRARWLPWIAVLATTWLALFPIASVDAYYHLATGRRILETRTIPTRGVGSATFGQVPWHDNEWGFQVIAASIGQAEREPSGVLVLTPRGRAGLIVLRAAALAATMAALAGTMARCGAGSGIAALGVWLTAFLTFGNLFWDVRPQIASYVAFAVVVLLLEHHRQGTRWALPAALGAVALWSNVHGAVVLGCVLFACEAAGAWLDRPASTEARQRARALTWVAAAGPVAACVNPLGWGQLAYAYAYARHPEIYAGNNEWTRPDLVHLPLLALTTALLVATIAAGARPRAGHLLRVGVFGLLFLTAIRHLPYFAIALVPVIAAALAGTPKLDPFRSLRNGRARMAAGVVLAGIVAGLSGAKQVSVVPRFTERPSRPLPEAQVRYLAEHHVEGAGFNAYRFGGFLMFRLYPREVVVMDGRNDLYGSFRTGVYEDVLLARPGWETLWRQLAARYAITWALLDARDPLALHLVEIPGWRRVPDDAFSGASGSSEFVLYLSETTEER